MNPAGISHERIPYKRSVSKNYFPAILPASRTRKTECFFLEIFAKDSSLHPREPVE